MVVFPTLVISVITEKYGKKISMKGIYLFLGWNENNNFYVGEGTLPYKEDWKSSRNNI